MNEQKNLDVCYQECKGELIQVKGFLVGRVPERDFKKWYVCVCKCCENKLKANNIGGKI